MFITESIVQDDPRSFTPSRHDGAECRRLRVCAGLTSEMMADIAGLPGQWAWVSIENGYEPIHPGCWALCLMRLGRHPEF